MSGSRGRHARPDEPDDVDVAVESASSDEAASHDRVGAHAVTPVTQPLPVVRRESSAPESPPVRAVAKRVPSALPALGRDEISDVPSSARATADRRRRARAGTTGEDQAAGDEQVAGAIEEQVAGGEEQVARGGAEPAEGHRSTPSVPRPRPEPPIERIGEQPPAAAPGDVELVPVGTRARPVPPADGSKPTPVAPSAALGLKDPAASAASAPPPPAPTAELAADSIPEEIVDAEIVDEQPRPYVAAHAQTDEWVTVTPAPAPEPVPVPQPAPAPPPLAAPTPPPLVAQSPAPAAASASLGPHTLVMPTVTEEPAAAASPPPLRPGGTSDTWETSPLPTVGDQYQGRRRAKRRSGRLTGWLVVIGVVLALSAAIAVPFLFTSGEPEPSAAEDPTTTQATSPTSATPTTAANSGLPIVLAPSATPTPTPTTESSTTTGEPTQTTTTNPAPPASFSVALEAESGSLSGCAATRNVGGATVVDRLGEDWGNCNRGRVTFNNVNLPAGTFTVTIYYVFGQDSPQWSSSRYGELEIERDGGGTDIEFGNTYPRTTSCCQSWTTSSFTISAGSYDITFTNPNRQGWSNRAPAIDRIVIQQQ